MSQLPQGAAILHLTPAQPDRPPERQATVPPRVQAAMHFLGMLSMKTQEVNVQTSEFSRTEQPAQTLTEHEEDTRNVALDTLDRYFAGKLDESPWDRPQERKRRPRQHLKLPKGVEVLPAVHEDDAKRERLPLLTIPCPACNGGNRLQGTPKRQQPDCDVCGNQRIVGIARVERSK